MRPVRRKISPHAARLRRDRTDAEDCFWQAVRNRQLDGGQHGEAKDARRTVFLEAKGFRILRFWNHDVLENLDGVLAVVSATLADSRT